MYIYMRELLKGTLSSPFPPQVTTEFSDRRLAVDSALAEAVTKKDLPRMVRPHPYHAIT